MSMLIQPYLEGRPIVASIRVDRDTVQDDGPVSRLFAGVARNSAGDMWKLSYFMGLPSNVSLFDSRRRTHTVYYPGLPEPAVTPASGRVRYVPQAPFPAEPPSEDPVEMLGMRCSRRYWKTDSGSTESWYSYDYEAYPRTVLKGEGYGTTIWYLADVKLEEPPSELFTEASIRASEPERLRNVWSVAGEVLSRMFKDSPPR